MPPPVPPPTDDQINQAIANALTAPSHVEVDGRVVKNQPLGDLTNFVNWIAAPAATARNVLNISQTSSGRSPLD